MDSSTSFQLAVLLLSVFSVLALGSSNEVICDLQRLSCLLASGIYLYTFAVFASKSSLNTRKFPGHYRMILSLLCLASLFSLGNSNVALVCLQRVLDCLIAGIGGYDIWTFELPPSLRAHRIPVNTADILGWNHSAEEKEAYQTLCDQHQRISAQTLEIRNLNVLLNIKNHIIEKQHSDISQLNERNDALEAENCAFKTEIVRLRRHRCPTQGRPHVIGQWNNSKLPSQADLAKKLASAESALTFANNRIIEARAENSAWERIFNDRLSALQEQHMSEIGARFFGTSNTLDYSQLKPLPSAQEIAKVLSEEKEKTLRNRADDTRSTSHQTSPETGDVFSQQQPPQMDLAGPPHSTASTAQDSMLPDSVDTSSEPANTASRNKVVESHLILDSSMPPAGVVDAAIQQQPQAHPVASSDPAPSDQPAAPSAGNTDVPVADSGAQEKSFNDMTFDEQNDELLACAGTEDPDEEDELGSELEWTAPPAAVITFVCIADGLSNETVHMQDDQTFGDLEKAWVMQKGASISGRKVDRMEFGEGVDEQELDRSHLISSVQLIKFDKETLVHFIMA